MIMVLTLHYCHPPSCIMLRLRPGSCLCVRTQELRIACAAAQLEREGGISPFISPLAQAGDAAALGNAWGIRTYACQLCVVPVNCLMLCLRCAAHGALREHIALAAAMLWRWSPC